MSMPGAYEDMDDPAPSLLPFHRTDIAELVEHTGNLHLQGEGAAQREESKYVRLCSFTELGTE